MRYELIADSPEEQAAMDANPAMRVLFDPFIPLVQARAIISSARLGVFEAIGRGEQICADLAEALDLDAETLEMVLRVLVSAGYLRRGDGGYRLSDLALATLLPDSPMRLAAWAEFNRFHWQVIGELERAVKTGRGIDSREFLSGEGDWAVQQRAMLETARPAAPWVASQVPVREGAQLLLDVGGSHGLYGAAICSAHPPLRSEVIELDETLGAAAELAKLEGIDDVVTHRLGDALTEDFGREACDVVFLGNLVHHFSERQNRDLLERIETALRPGGTVAVWDFRYPDADAAPDLIADSMALLFRISSTSRCYRVDEMTGWLGDAGFADVREHRPPSPMNVLITGRKA